MRHSTNVKTSLPHASQRNGHAPSIPRQSRHPSHMPFTAPCVTSTGHAPNVPGRAINPLTCLPLPRLTASPPGSRLLALPPNAREAHYRRASRTRVSRPLLCAPGLLEAAKAPLRATGPLTMSFIHSLVYVLTQRWPNCGEPLTYTAAQPLWISNFSLTLLYGAILPPADSHRSLSFFANLDVTGV